MKFNKLITVLIAGSFFFTSCNSDDDAINAPAGAYDNGVFITNQGNFLQNNSTISFISDDFMLQNDIYNAVNSDILGDTAQDMGFNNDLAYIVLNVSNAVKVVNRYTFEHVATINSGLVNPRYIAFADGKAYVTNWGDGTVTTDDYIAVIDLSSNMVVTTIPVSEGPEQIIEEDGKLYVSHAGGYGFGNTVTVINAGSNSVSNTITVGDVPKFMDIDDNKLYVLSEGLPYYAETETWGKLQVIDLNNNSVILTLNFNEGEHPSNLTIEDDTIYYTIDANVYAMQENATSLPASALFNLPEGVFSVSALGVDDNRIYVADAADYTNEGKVYIYSTSGSPQQNYTVGVTPAGFYFN